MMPPDRDGLMTDRNVAVMIAAGLMLAVFAVFGQTVWFGFTEHDDPMYVTENPWVLGGLTPAGVAWAFSTGRGSVWVPLTWLSLMLDTEVYGSWAGGFHLTNVLLHAACAAGLFLLLRCATSQTWPAAIAAAIFALHPMRVEAVAWVTSRKDVLSGLCFLLTLWAYGWYVRRPSPGRYAAVAAALALGLMAKSMLVTTPVLLLLLDFWPLGRMHRLRDCVGLAVEKLPLLVLSALVAMKTISVQGNSLVHDPHMTPTWRLAQATLVYVGYLGMALWPTHLAAAYPRPGAGVPWPAVAASAVLLLGITLAAWRERRRFPYLLAGWLWYLVALLPVSGLLQVGVFSMADRFTYLPLIGPVVAIVWLVTDLTNASAASIRRQGGDPSRWPAALPAAATPGRAMMVTAAVVTGVLALSSIRQTNVWRDNETLWRSTLDNTHGNWFAHLGFAVEMLKQRDFTAAETHALRALDVAPANSLAQGLLADVAARRGCLREAAEIWRRLIAVDPRDEHFRIRLGGLLIQESHHCAAVEHYRVAVTVAPESIEAITGLAEALLGCGEPREAVETMLAGHRLWPANPLIARQLGRVLLAVGRSHEAAGQLRRAVEHDPRDAAAWNGLGVALGQSGRVGDAIPALRKAAEIEPASSGFHRDLGFALRESRRFADAAASYRRAVEIEPGNRMAVNDLAWLLATCPDPAVRSGTEAVSLAVGASRLEGDDDPTVLDTLAAAHAEAADFAEATAVARRALELAEGAGNAGLAAEVRAHLELFAAGRPVRDPP